MIAIAIILFVSYSALLMLSSSTIKSNLLNRKVQVSNDLDDRVKDFILTESFDETTSDGVNFAQNDITNSGNSGQGYGNSSEEGNQSGGQTGKATGVDYNLYEFTATDSNDGLTVSQKAFERD